MLRSRIEYHGHGRHPLGVLSAERGQLSGFLRIVRRAGPSAPRHQRRARLGAAPARNRGGAAARPTSSSSPSWTAAVRCTPCTRRSNILSLVGAVTFAVVRRGRRLEALGGFVAALAAVFLVAAHAIAARPATPNDRWLLAIHITANFLGGGIILVAGCASALLPLERAADCVAGAPSAPEPSCHPSSPSTPSCTACSGSACPCSPSASSPAGWSSSTRTP